MTRSFTRIVMALLCLLGYTQVHAQSGNVYENVPASAVWAFNTAVEDVEQPVVAVPGEGFSLMSFSSNGATLNGTGTRNSADRPALDAAGNEIVFVKYRPKAAKTDVLSWNVKPAKGLTFTPTKVSGWIQRFGTDS